MASHLYGRRWINTTLMAQEAACQLSIGLDVGGTTFAGGVFAAGELLADGSWSTPADKNAPAVVKALADSVHQLLTRANADISEVRGLAVGMPGNVDRATGLVKDCPNLPVVNGLNMAEALQNRLGQLSVFVANDAYCATLGELRYGAGREVENLLMLTLGTGIGGGIALNNQVLRGPRQMMGEIGHMIIVPDGPKCGCGNIGCFEAVAGKQAIVDLARRYLQYGRESRIDDLTGGDPAEITPQVVAQAARQGDEVASAVMNQVGYYIGLALCNAIVMCDPDIIVLGGGIAAAGEVLFAPVRQTVKYRSPYTGFDVNNIVPAALGNKAGIYGAAAVVEEGLA